MTVTRTLDEFRIKFRVVELMVLENRSWTWSVRPAQPTLGAGVLSLNRYALKLSDVTQEEFSDLAEMIPLVEKRVSTAFNHNIMNYLMLMMVDHHVHYHVIPRYDADRTFSDRQWVDNGWPALPVLADAQHADEPGLLGEIQEKLKSS
jgi:diadenosine tetraphosphate (Ap4A) HIT family hydrolase